MKEEEEERTPRAGRDSRDLGRARDQMLFALFSFRDGGRQGDLVHARQSEGPRPGDPRSIVHCLLWLGRGDGSGAKRFGCKARWFCPPLETGKLGGKLGQRHEGSRSNLGMESHRRQSSPHASQDSKLKVQATADAGCHTAQVSVGAFLFQSQLGIFTWLR